MVERRTGAEGEENSLSRRMYTTASQFTQISPSCGDCSHRVLYPTPILRMGKLRSAQGTDRYAISYQEASVEDDHTVFLLQPPGPEPLASGMGLLQGVGFGVSPHLPHTLPGPRSFVPAPGLPRLPS